MFRPQYPLHRTGGRAGQERVVCAGPSAAAPEHDPGAIRNNTQEAVQVLGRLGEIDRRACGQRVQRCFSIETMVEGYERVYGRIFEGRT